MGGWRPEAHRLGTNFPFAVGDQIFVEGLTKYGTEGDGFNSEDYGYGFFTVQS